jgi:prephenate dehydrogenase
MTFFQITIVGTGLIGGSFALAARKAGFRGRIVGCDREEVLARAREMGAIDGGSSDPGEAVAGSDLVLLATPVGAILDFLKRVGPRLGPNVSVTDAGSTKAEIMTEARAVFGGNVAQRFLGGHPIAGKERSGIEEADADLFRGSVWLFTPAEGQELSAGRVGEFVALVEFIGARAVEIDAERHDRLCAWTSHLPQMVSTALAAALEEEFGDDPELRAIGGRALREMTRIAASPYSMWRDIALTNSENIAEALQRLEQRLAHLRENLRTPELRAEFERGNRFWK